MTSDAGLLLIRKADEQIGLLDRLAAALPDPRDPERIEHSLAELLRQQVNGLVQGYENLNNHDRLRHNLALRTAPGKVTLCASGPTLCRFEQRADRTTSMRPSAHDRGALVFLGYSGFCRRRILSSCERNEVDYIVGLTRNRRIKQFA